MTETIGDLEAAGTAYAEADKQPAFYVVSRRKFAILYLGTWGLYSLYWFYKNWDNYRDARPFDSQESAIWPVPRAIFSIFFIHSLFRRIKALGEPAALVQSWRNTLHAWLLVVLLVVSSTLSKAADKGIGSPTTDVASVAMLLPMLFVFLHAQRMINLTCNDPEGASNDRLTKANKAWVVAGGILWLVAAIGLIGSGPDTPTF